MRPGPFSATLASLLLLALLCSAPQASAHPHVYIDASLTFALDDAGLTALRQDWLFDEIFTHAIMADLDLTPETLATTLGQEKIRDGAFNYLANYDYFTFVETGGQRLPVTADGFQASMREGRLAYSFTVPLNLPFDRIVDFRAGVFDREYYSDILLLKDAVAFEVDGIVQVSHVVRPARDLAYWQFIVPEVVHLAVSDQPGSDIDLPAAVLPETVELGPIERLMALVRDVQKDLTLQLNGFGLDIRGDPFGSAFWMFLALSFVYGVVHAVGPGHGKTVVCSYFLSNPGTLFSGALMGNVITFVHMGSAALAVGAAYLIFSTGMGGFTEASRALQPASYALLALMGLFLFGKAVRDLAKGGLVAEPSCPVDADEIVNARHTKRALVVSFVTGLVPCPGAAVILAFAIGQDIFWSGLFAILTMAVGMGITTTLFAWAAVAARNFTLSMSGANRRLFNWVYAGLSLCGAAAIAVFGTLLFISSNV